MSLLKAEAKKRKVIEKGLKTQNICIAGALISFIEDGRKRRLSRIQEAVESKEDLKSKLLIANKNCKSLGDFNSHLHTVKELETEQLVIAIGILYSEGVSSDTMAELIEVYHKMKFGKKPKLTFDDVCHNEGRDHWREQKKLDRWSQDCYLDPNPQWRPKDCKLPRVGSQWLYHGNPKKPVGYYAEICMKPKTVFVVTRVEYLYHNIISVITCCGEDLLLKERFFKHCVLLKDQSDENLQKEEEFIRKFW